MKAFTDIEAFRHVVKNVRHWTAKHNKPLPVISYKGTVKLHGTNAGVRVTHAKVQPQGRNRILDIGSDNFGFAAYCHNKHDTFTAMAEKVLNKSLSKGDDITFFGEWCGSNIQKNVAVAELPKHFVIFSGYNGATEEYFDVDRISELFNSEETKKLNDLSIYFINQAEHYSIDVDFSEPEQSVQALEELTLAVEKKCPWAALLGAEGVGEGIVWCPTDKELFKHTDLWFKTKGLEHKRTNARTGSKLETDPVTAASIKEFVEAVLPKWRLEQGVSQLEQDGLEIIPQNTGIYLKWICQDVLKEEADVLCANNLSWKDVQGAVCKTARQYYLTEIESKAFEKV